MTKTWRVCRYLLLWSLPTLVSLLILAFGFLYWSVGTQAGTRWSLHVAAQQLDGEAAGVRGTLLRGVYIENLALSMPDLDIGVAGLHLKVQWPALLRRTLRVEDLSALRLSVDQRAPARDETESTPMRVPALPVDLIIERLSLEALEVRRDGESLLPVEVLAFSASGSMDRHAARVRLDKLDMAREDMLVSVSGELKAHGLAAPWPLELDLQGYAQEHRAQSPLCVGRFLGYGPEGTKPAEGTKPVERTKGAASASGEGEADQSPAACRVDARLRLAGSLDKLSLNVQGHGADVALDTQAELFPERSFPLGEARLELTLPGKAGLTLNVDPAPADAQGARSVQARLVSRNLDLGAWLPEELGASVLGLEAQATVGLDARQRVRALGVRLALDPAAKWNGQTLSGSVRLDRLGTADGTALFDIDEARHFDPRNLVLSGVDIDLALGGDRLRAQGAIATDATQLDLAIEAPRLDALWPKLPGGASLRAALAGTLARHTLTFEGRYTPEHGREGVLGEAPVAAAVRLAGGWEQRPEGSGWRGMLGAMDVSHADLSVRSEQPIPIQYLPAPDPAGPQWRVGAGQLDLRLRDETLFRLDHVSSEGAGTHWATKGRIASLVVSAERIERIQAWRARGEAKQGGVRTPLSEQARRSRLEAAVDWSLSFDDALRGEIHVRRIDGDLVVPGDTPIELGLRQAELDVDIRRTAPGQSAVQAVLDVKTREMGNMRVAFQTPLHAEAGGGFSVREEDPKTVRIQAESEDLAWVNLFLPGGIEVGGTVHADIQGRSASNGRWSLSGPLTGEGISVLSLDQGVRLLDGTLRAHFDNDRVILDGLRFPARPRVTPKEWRTAEWVATNPEAQGGALTLSGQWSLFGQAGGMTVDFYRYPILQRSDRYAMVSGKLSIDGALPEIIVRGSIQADAGWFDLDILNSIPSLDGDVYVLEPGQEQVVEAAPLDVDAEVKLDLGPRFYLTGYGVNSGLVGDITVRMKQGKLTGVGALRTRGGAIDAYGQHLQLRRGTVTFQGDVTNPVISIEALRTDVAVQAGVRVAGTARRPRIDLVSYPDVNESEKLTWLLLGHGPDDAGGDMALLFSVGTSFLTEGEPFYRRFGIDEFSMRSGELGSTGSILPAESVVSGVASGASDIERRFVLASKTLTKDLSVSIEQALSQTGTVGRLSYRLMRGLRAEVTAGTVTGLALVYRWFSRN